jgi:hypothetical protein
MNSQAIKKVRLLEPYPGHWYLLIDDQLIETAFTDPDEALATLQYEGIIELVTFTGRVERRHV